MNLNVLFAIFRRNFFCYFTNATGYVFICVFVLLSSFAAFWPDEFFNANLANLDQLNAYFPYIMLIFIPAITMSTWAEERREGTDELLLTIPAKDIDLVLGKYLATVAIVTVSLLFSMVTNCIVLDTLGTPDWGQMAATYVGYWFVGIAMLGVGQVASFLTKNLTIAYILGVLFNAPLIFISLAGSFLPQSIASSVTFWGISSRFADFGNGVISFGSIAYFVIVAVVMLYICVILIGYRRWIHSTKLFHYLARVIASVVIGVCFCVMFQLNDVRWDWTVNQLSSLSAESKRLLKDLKKDRVVQVEAFVSPEVPEEYIQTRRNLLNMLREIEAYGGGRVRVRVYYTKLFTEEADRAMQRYGIKPKTLPVIEHGTAKSKEVFLGVVIRSGLNRVTIPFFQSGAPVQYELIHSICTVLEEKRKKIGILMTSAELYGRSNAWTGSINPDWQIVDKLEKQYEVVKVDPNKPIKPGSVDALLVVQPSLLDPAQMDNFIAAIKQGIPTAIFEAPGMVKATKASDKTRSPKESASRLWKMLGVDFPSNTVIWQTFNPYPKVDKFNNWKEHLFIDAALGREKVFGHNPISSGLQQLLLLYSGAFRKLNTSTLEMEPLISTSNKTGIISVKNVLGSITGAAKNIDDYRIKTNQIYVLAAHITGMLPPEAPKGSSAVKVKSNESKINVVLVADVDMISPAFFAIRDQKRLPESQGGIQVDFKFDNITFVLNALDTLAGDNRFISIRSLRRYHPVLTKIDEETKQARSETEEIRKRLRKEGREKIVKEVENLETQYAELQQKAQSGKTDAKLEDQQRRAMNIEFFKRKTAIEKAARREFEKDTNKINRKLEDKIRSVQNWYKGCAILLPPILPLTLALVVFYIRRLQERRGAVLGRTKKKKGNKNR